MFDYEKEIVDNILQHKRVWIKKATGLGVTECILRLILWLILSRTIWNSTTNSYVCIVTGPRIDLAEDLIRRVKIILDNAEIQAKDTGSKTQMILENTIIEAFPSHHVDAMRGLDNVSFIFLDEADFFPPSQQEDARSASERYIGKSDAMIAMVSTPQAPGGLFDKIEQEQKSLYHKMFLDYRRGLGKIYSEADIIQAKASPSFEREYNLKYIGIIGNVFSHASIDACLIPSIEPTTTTSTTFKVNPMAAKSIGIDPGFGSSSFAFVVTQYVNHKIQIIRAEQYDAPLLNEMIERFWQIKNECNYVSNIYVDGANPEVWKALKLELGETIDEKRIQQTMKECKDLHIDLENRMTVIPVSFAQHGAEMLAHAQRLLDGGHLNISSSLDKLMIALRTAVAEDYRLDKEKTSYHDILDAFRLALHFYKSDKKY